MFCSSSNYLLDEENREDIPALELKIFVISYKAYDEMKPAIHSLCKGGHGGATRFYVKLYGKQTLKIEGGRKQIYGQKLL